ncbi:MAG: hypothetical protein ACLP4W_30105 [Mycobacterium sp.]|uniref:hypothetical protein n=1 Tax=Mycobacterium sp. TaxID=1785 RepID=UPI003F9AA89C
MTSVDTKETAVAQCASPQSALSARPYGHEEFVAWLTASCQSQNVPLTINDPAVIAHVVALLGGAQSCTPFLRQSRGFQMSRGDG